jgi:hypothetical protein
MQTIMGLLPDGPAKIDENRTKTFVVRSALMRAGARSATFRRKVQRSGDGAPRRATRRKKIDRFFTAAHGIPSRANDHDPAHSVAGNANFLRCQTAGNKEVFFSFDTRAAMGTICITE